MRGVLEQRITIWSVALLIALLFGLTNLPWTLDDYDQAKQAFTSFEMVNEGPWLYQHTPNERIATKPPLVGWVSVAIYGVTRSWELAWRLPPAAAALVLIVVLAREARNAYGAVAGLIAMSAFGLNLLSPRLATLVRTDMPLALVTFLLGLTIWRKVRAAEPWQTRDRLLVFALLTAAMLIKGPIVYAFLLPGIALFELRRWRMRDAVSAWCGWWPWIASLAIFAAWAAAGIAWMPGFYEQVVLKEFAGRFSETVHRPQPLYFYLPHLLHKFAPWSLLSIALGVLAWRNARTEVRGRWRQVSPDLAWLLCWSLGGLLVMSLIPSKRVDRVFP
ncbi:MAG TPA: glycosyltransferase family 39 protein, partial [Chthoniobacterales bacterium]